MRSIASPFIMHSKSEFLISTPGSKFSILIQASQSFCLFQFTPKRFSNIYVIKKKKKKISTRLKFEIHF